MKKIVSILSLILILIIVISCEKEVINTDDNQTSQVISLKQQPLPPIRFFECGAPDPSSPYPCPNARCYYMGWDCLMDVIIYGITNIDDYNRAASILDEYINVGNTEEFFSEYSEEVGILMPELKDPARQAILTDLQNGITSVKKHPVFNSISQQELYIYQIYVVETGDPPNYGEL
ncbi:MAG: hypothetical protein M0Q51_15190 [Bacteroidales bacterium]|nr:hypothetical protein [Bacteroidales bacterium]